MITLSQANEIKLLKDVTEHATQPSGWLRILESIDSMLNCRSFLAEYDDAGRPSQRFGGQKPACELGGLLQKIETEGGRDALHFLLTDATLYYPYCKIALDRGRAKNGTDPASALSAPLVSGDCPAGMERDFFERLLAAPGVISPVWRTEQSTILLGCVFPAHTPESIDAAHTTETFRAIIHIVTPGINSFNEIEKERHNNHIHCAMLSAMEGSVVLVDQDGNVLAQTETGVTALTALDAAVLRGKKLVFKNRQLDSYLQSFQAAAALPRQKGGAPDGAPAPDAAGSLDFSVSLAGLNGALKRIVVQPVPAPCRHYGIAADFWFLIRVRETAYLPESVERVLQDHYGLSQSEARLARNLTISGSMNETIAHLGITRNTAKTHLRRIYEKTGMHTQLQLARLVHKISGLF